MRSGFHQRKTLAKASEPIADYLPPKPVLSSRAGEILMLAAQGQRTKQIARTLWLSPHTVRNHLKRAYKVLGASDLTEALLRAIVAGHITLPPS